MGRKKNSRFLIQRKLIKRYMLIFKRQSEEPATRSSRLLSYLLKRQRSEVLWFQVSPGKRFKRPFARPYLKNTQHRVGGVAQMIVHLA
jgi:hypothetical protein